MKTRMLALGSSALLVLLALTGCFGPGSMPGMGGYSTASPDSAEDGFNRADVAFSMMMIPHHQEAIDMADAVLDKDGVDERVQELAADIKAAQAPEIELMSGWLDEWGFPTMSGMNHGGMMSDVDMEALEAASGTEASRLFLDQMIVHHLGAIDMAEVEIAQGENAETIALAEKIIVDQTAEIEIMRDLLDSL